MSSSNRRPLTTTSYAVLGLLYTRPYSPYELTRQMKRDLHYCWPRAERAIYYEPKNLVAHGLATASEEKTGRRKRAVYTITPAGRHAFARWLEEPVAAAPIWESEAMVRATFAHRGSKDALLHAIASIREHGAAMRQVLEGQVRDYQETGGPFPEQLHLIALTGKFLFDYVALLERWGDWADAQVRTWPSITSASEVPPEFAHEVFAEMQPGRTSPPAPQAARG